jgi:hypothetical protein
MDGSFLGRKGDVTLDVGPTPRLCFEMALKFPGSRAVQVLSYQCEVVLGKELMKRNFIGYAYLNSNSLGRRVEPGSWDKWYFYFALEQTVLRAIEQARQGDLLLGLLLMVVGVELEGEAVQKPFRGQPSNEDDTTWSIIHYRLAESDWRSFLSRVGYRDPSSRPFIDVLRRFVAWCDRAIRRFTTAVRKVWYVILSILFVVAAVIGTVTGWGPFLRLIGH